jgi:DNA repair exonuclease SbcCD ATPase subunit
MTDLSKVGKEVYCDICAQHVKVDGELHVGGFTTVCPLCGDPLHEESDEQELRRLRHELAVAREKVESLWLQRERQRATINNMHDRLVAVIETEALEMAENEELRRVIRDAAEKLEGALHSCRMLADDVMEVVGQLREVLR